MNRRSFVERMALGAASFMILPGAGRVWRARRVVERPLLVIATMRGETSTYYDHLLARLRASGLDIDMRVVSLRACVTPPHEISRLYVDEPS